MHTEHLHDNERIEPRQFDRSEEAAIAGECARHLLDMAEESGRERTIVFISKLNVLASLDREALWVVLHLMTGDLSELTRSYEEQARERGLDKQAVQQQLERVIASVRRHYPELANAIVYLRRVTAAAAQTTLA